MADNNEDPIKTIIIEPHHAGGSAFMNVVLVLVILLGLLYFFRDNIMAAIGIGPNAANGSNGTSTTTATTPTTPAAPPPPAVTPPSAATITPAVTTTTIPVTTTLPPVITVNPPVWPLQLLTGGALLEPDQRVKNVQAYCNKFGGTNIDIDGSYGQSTQDAVMKTFGVTTISQDLYNKTIAPAMGVTTV